MMKKEYEYSEKVKSIEPFIEYCKKNNYKLLSKVNQKRVLYENEKGILARITINEENEIKKFILTLKIEMNLEIYLKFVENLEK